MSVIEKLSQKLVDAVMSCRPECNTPGFVVTDSKPGLRCNLCGLPTKSTLYHISSCCKCAFIYKKSTLGTLNMKASNIVISVTLEKGRKDLLSLF